MLNHHTRRESGFTLMELLIAVAIVAVLAAVGIPTYLSLQSGSKATEANANIDGIRTCQESYKMVNNSYLSCATSPRATPNETPVDWADLGTGFTNIGFQPNGQVRFVFEVVAAAGPTFIAGAVGDTDGDTDYIGYVSTESVGVYQVADDSDANISGLTDLSAFTIDDQTD